MNAISQKEKEEEEAKTDGTAEQNFFSQKLHKLFALLTHRWLYTYAANRIVTLSLYINVERGKKGKIFTFLSNIPIVKHDMDLYE